MYGLRLRKAVHLLSTKVPGDYFFTVSAFALHYPLQQSKWFLSRNGRRCHSGHPNGSGYKSYSPGLKKLHVHHAASPADLATQQSTSFAQWHFPYSTEFTQLKPFPQAANLGWASVIPCNSGYSEMLVIPGTWVLSVWKETMKSPWFVSSPQELLYYKDPAKRLSSIQAARERVLGKSWCAWPDENLSTAGKLGSKRVWLLSPQGDT